MFEPHCEVQSLRVFILSTHFKASLLSVYIVLLHCRSRIFGSTHIITPSQGLFVQTIHIFTPFKGLILFPTEVTMQTFGRYYSHQWQDSDSGVCITHHCNSLVFALSTRVINESKQISFPRKQSWTQFPVVICVNVLQRSIFANCEQVKNSRVDL